MTPQERNLLGRGYRLIEQKPVRRKTALRSRNDHYTVPTFRVSDRPVRPQPYDGGDWSRYRDDPQTFAWSEMRDPAVWLGGVLVFLAMVVFIVTVSVIGPA